MNLTEQELLDRVLYRDAMLIVLNKPKGIAVHPGPGRGPNLESVFHFLQFGLPRMPALVHRLDRDTSGCLVLGRHRKALRKGGELFQQGKVDKTYLAVCIGTPENPEGRINAKLRKKNDIKAGWEMLVCPDGHAEGQDSVTDYKVLSSANGYSLIAFYPRTGRTHQIRVHAAHIGCPLQGDPRYGEMSEENRAAPICLHAAKIVLPYYPKKDPLIIEAPLTEEFLLQLKKRGLQLPEAF